MTQRPGTELSLSIGTITGPLPDDARALLESAGRRQAGRIVHDRELAWPRAQETDAAGHTLHWFTAREGNRLVALAALAPGGRIADLVMAPAVDESLVLEPLLRALEAVARGDDDAEIEILVPDGDPAADRLRELGYRTVETPATTLQVVNWRALLEALAAGETAPAEPDADDVATGAESELFLEIRSQGPGPAPAIHLSLRRIDGRLVVRNERPPFGREARAVDGSALAAWLLGGPDPGGLPEELRRFRPDGGWSTPLGHRR